MRVDMVGAILCVVFENKNRSVIPVRAVRNRVHYAAERQIIVRNICGRTSIIGTRASSVIVRQIEQYQRRQFILFAFVGLTGFYE